MSCFVRSILLLSTLVAVVIQPMAGRANDPYLVKDINVSANGASSEPDNFCAVGSVAYFSATTPTTGKELWKSNGTMAGTVLVKDIFVGDFSSSPKSLTAVGDTLYFVATDDVNGDALWKTDGTGEGTVLVAGAGSGVHSPGMLTGLEENLYFVASNGRELWKSDGTVEGTSMLVSFDLGVRSLKVVGDTLYFVANVGGFGGGGTDELWKSDGTGEGTLMLKRFSASIDYSPPQQLVASGNLLFFRANDGSNGAELWKSDGTSEGTEMVKDIRPGSFGSGIDYLTLVGDALYFQASDGTNGQELWRTDGTGVGTLMVRDIFGGSGSSSPAYLAAVGGTLYFRAKAEDHTVGLWRSDGTTEGTVKVTLNSGVIPQFPFTVVGNLMFYQNGFRLWRTDGTAEGTSAIGDFSAGGISGAPASLTPVGDSLFFRASDGTSGAELWKSDGTAGGTIMVKDIFTGSADSSFYDLTTVGSDLFFGMIGGTDRRGLWKSNGTEAGTVRVKDLNFADRLRLMGSTLFFRSNDGSNGTELWKSDGMVEGTVMVKDIGAGFGSSHPGTLTPVGNTLFFHAEDLSRGTVDLWKSDGTPEGTVMIKDILPVYSTYQVNMREVGNLLYFIADNGSSKLWKSDGTPEGTVILKDLGTGASGLSSSSLTSIGNYVYFQARDGTSGYELWKSDGTTLGTSRVKDIFAGSGSSFPRHLTRVGSNLYFVAGESSSGDELWKSDGTAAGTVKVKDIRSGSLGANIENLTVLGDILFFVADDGNKGPELWKSNGTAAGTVLVKDIREGSGGSTPGSLTPAGNILYFRASDGSNGTELWRSDGTAEGTVMVRDLVAGSGSSNPSLMTMAGKRLFFSALAEETGTELWAMGLFSASFSDITATPSAGNANLVISGQVVPFPSATVTVEYGKTSALGSTLVVGGYFGDTAQSFSATLYPGGIDPLTNYYFRVRATGEFGETDTGVLSQRSFSENADLGGVSLTHGTLTPPFAGSIFNYTCTVPRSVSSVSVTPTQADPTTTIEFSLNGEDFQPVASGNSIAWSLGVGDNLLEIRTTAQAGNTRTYAITVTRLDRPSIAISTPSAIGGNGATLGGNVSADGGAAIIERGVVFSPNALNPDPFIDGPGVFKEVASGGLGTFSMPVSGLAQGAGYSVRAFATNSEGTTYSNVVVFYTDTSVVWNNGTASFTRDLVGGGRQRYHLSLGDQRIVLFQTEGGVRLRAELRDDSGRILVTFTGDADFTLEEMLPAGNYRLDVYRTAGSGQTENYTLTIDANTVPETRPDVTVGAAASDSIGAEIFSPEVQFVRLNSFRAGPVTGYVNVSNRGNFPDVQSVGASGGNTFFGVAFFGPDGNLTADLLAGGYRTTELKSDDAAVPIRVTITPNRKKLSIKKGRKTRVLRKALIVKVTATSSFDPSVHDEASVHVKTQ